jgi:alkylhydroperoxidase family enzyme
MFEWEQHAPLLQDAGLSKNALDLVEDSQADFSGEAAKKALSPDQRAVLKYADAMTKTVTVTEAVFQELKNFFSDKEVVEITATVAAYSCVSRFLVAFDLGGKESPMQLDELRSPQRHKSSL